MLKAGHHGSRTSSSAALLQALRPDDVLISAGFANSFGHPHAQALSRFAEVGSRVHATLEAGTLTAVADGDAWVVAGHRARLDEDLCRMLAAFSDWSICDWFGDD